MKKDLARTALFISHASPEDNAFVRWIGAKLAAMGFEVWADVMRLHAGADWSRELEAALRERSAKMLVVCTPNSLQKQGVRNEIEIATQVARTLKDNEFIIPLRLAPYELPFRIAHAQYIDFETSWGQGFAELVELLVNVHRVPQRAGSSADAWTVAQAAFGEVRTLEFQLAGDRGAAPAHPLLRTGHRAAVGTFPSPPGAQVARRAVCDAGSMR
jgi:TIR domain